MSKVTWIVYIIFYSFYVHSMIHVELAFVKVVRSVSRSFFFWHVDVQLFQRDLLKRLLLFHCIAFNSSSSDQLIIFKGPYFWAFYSVPLICLSTLSPIPYYLDYCSLIVSLQVKFCLSLAGT